MGQSEGPEPSRLRKLRPYEEKPVRRARRMSQACVTNRCARPTRGGHGRTGGSPAQRFKGANRTTAPKWRKQRGPGRLSRRTSQNFPSRTLLNKGKKDSKGRGIVSQTPASSKRHRALASSSFESPRPEPGVFYVVVPTKCGPLRRSRSPRNSTDPYSRTPNSARQRVYR